MNQRMELQEKANAARDKQVSQLAEEMASLKRNPSKLPSDTLKNPSHQSSSSSNSKNSHVNSITIEDSVENDTVEEFETGASLIPIQIGEFKTTKALVDYGASVSVIPGSVYDYFDFGPLQEVDTTLVLADFTRRRPRGKLVGVAVKVGDFYYPEDFLVLDYAPAEKEEEPRVILGRPSLATSNAQINYQDGTVCMTFGNHKLILSIFSNSYDYSFENKYSRSCATNGCLPRTCEDDTKKEKNVYFDRSKREREKEELNAVDVKSGARISSINNTKMVMEVVNEEKDGTYKKKPPKKEKVKKPPGFENEQRRLACFGPRWEALELPLCWRSKKNEVEECKHSIRPP
ncbi:uncharacterized protein LOC143594479 [Bidens hawaiensis]|uniref:uncharacterized protein LOC143594479 n=1 Tax=Bidens hawaiensis TaxID=980011 RepID=UPI00404ACE3F